MTEWIARKIDRIYDDLVIRGKVIPKEIVQILALRGYDTPEKIEQYFAPSLNDLHDPFLLHGMERAVDRLLQALSKDERVMIHGDYDTDGITATALLVRNLRKLGIRTLDYIPHRLEEGYGLSQRGIRYAKENGCSLVVTVDCGITEKESIEYAVSQGLDVIICDHHKPKEILPQAYALLDPKLPDSPYPFSELAGVGVAYKLLQALFSSLDMPQDELHQDLDLVALGTIVDVVPLVDENRILAKYGLKFIQKSNKKGIKAILKETSLTQRLTSYHVGFIIGPRINACGRLRSAQDALTLLLTDDGREAQRLAHRLSEDNTQRQHLEDTIYNEAQEQIDKIGLYENRVIVLAQENWHVGVVGIVASRLSEEFYKPTILLSVKNGRAKGSGRSIPGFDITSALTEHQNLLGRFGGHAQAAGLELAEKNVTQLRDALNNTAAQCDMSLFQRTRRYDIALNIAGVTAEMIHYLKYFEPTGMSNPQPVFYGGNLEVVGVPRIVGTHHLKFAVRDAGVVFQALAYGHAETILKMESGKTRIDCLYTISEDSFYGKRKATIKIKDMNIEGEDIL